MPKSFFKDFLNSHQYILGEGAVIERIRRDTSCELDDLLINSAFIYNTPQRTVLEKITRQYIDIGHHYNLPLLLSTPTWRASKERIDKAGYSTSDVNGDNYLFLEDVKRSYGDYSNKILICGLMSCRGDAYKPQEGLATTEAHSFHSWQAEKLAQTGIDFLLAATLPALEEAKGIASAMAQTSKSYIISFVLRPEGTLLDGTPIGAAIEEIDTTVHPAPIAYLANCTHPTSFRAAYLHQGNSSIYARKRIIGLLANTSALSPEELDNSPGLRQESPDIFAASLSDLHTDFGLKILGGCCGTNQQHIDKLAQCLHSNK